MRTFVILLTAALLAFPLSAGEWKGREPVHSPGIQPVTELRSNGTAIIDFVVGSQAAVVGKTDSLLEARFAPTADQIVKMPHALFLLADGTVLMKAIMYRWTTPVDVQIAVPYSDKWQVHAVYVGGVMDYTKVNAVPPMFLSGHDFSSGIAAAAVFTVDDEPPRIRSNSEPECFPTGGGCFVCYRCWWEFCGDPYTVGCSSPIILDLGGRGYRLTSLSDGVKFDLRNEGVRRQTAWTEPGEEVCFLALDRDGNGRIENGAELFGNYTALRSGAFAPNGFVALAEFDDNGDSMIDAHDRVWSSLLLWTDRDHDGSSASDELSPIAESIVTTLETNHRVVGRRDQWNNLFRYASTFRLEKNGNSMRREYYDVFFRMEN